MARLSRQTREYIKIAITVIVLGILLYFYVIYPLGKVQDMWGRADGTANLPDSLADSVANDPSAFLESGLTADTFRVDVDAFTKLACVYLEPQVGESVQVKGTVVLLHPDRSNRESMAPLSKALLDSGYAVSAFDQRASGRSTEDYHGDGQLEARDLEAVLGYLDIRGKARHPLILVGYETGADAAILASREERRIDRVVAIGPYFTTDAKEDALFAREGALWLPLRSTIFWWWYAMRSGYTTPRLEADSIRAAGVPTTLLMPPDRMNSEEAAKFDQVSPDTMVTIEALAADSALARDQIVAAVAKK